MSRILTGLIGIGLIAVAVPAAAEQPRPCDRACLIATGEKVLQAMVDHDPHIDAISPHARYTENGQELIMPDGLWRTASKTGSYRLRVVDPETGMITIFSTMEENGAPTNLSTRIRVRDRVATEIETTIARPDSTVFGGLVPHPEQLTLRPEFDQILPPTQRRPRWQLIEIANTYFRALENNNGKDHLPSFDDACHRIENSIPTTNRPQTDPTKPRTAVNMGCREAFAAGYYREDTRLRGMRFLAVDEERGLVQVNGFFDHDATIRGYTLADGREIKVARTAPWTWMISEIFKIRDGKIWQVEAVLLSVPYGMKSNWDNGWKMPSPQEELEKSRL